MGRQNEEQQAKTPGKPPLQLARNVLIWWLMSLGVLTIVPRGQALGMTEQLSGEERHNLSLSYLKGRLAVMLGGCTAEEIVFDEVTTGAENDLVEATRLARRR